MTFLMESHSTLNIKCLISWFAIHISIFGLVIVLYLVFISYSRTDTCYFLWTGKADHKISDSGELLFVYSST